MIVFLSGCQRDISVNYFLENPKQLQEEIQHCERSNEQSMSCNNATEAGRIFSDLIDKRSQDPEKFGLQVIQAEQMLVSSKIKLEQYEAENNPKLATVQSEYQNQLHRVKVLLAVVAAMNHIE